MWESTKQIEKQKRKGTLLPKIIFWNIKSNDITPYPGDLDTFCYVVGVCNKKNFEKYDILMEKWSFMNCC